MAIAVGAETVGLDKFYGHVLSRDALTNEHLWPYPQLDVICAKGIVVTTDGRRFADEGQEASMSPTPLRRSTTPCRRP